MLDIVTQTTLEELMEVSGPRCITFYLPTHPAGPGVKEGAIRLRNLIAAAGRELERRGVASRERRELLDPASALVEDAGFWEHTEQGLGVFLDASRLQRFRLSTPVEDAVMVSDRFWIAPLLPFVASEDRFHVLALSQNEVRVVECVQDTVDVLDLGAVPASLDEALRLDDRESQLQSHGADRVGRGDVSAQFHGQGGAGEFDDVDQERFLHLVDRGLTEVVGGDSDPLVLAGVDEIVARFRKVSHQRRIVDGQIGGNPEGTSAELLCAQGAPLVSAQFGAQLDALRAFGESHARRAESVLDLVEASAAGRVAHLFVRIGHRCWGSVSPGGDVSEHDTRGDGDVDLVDVIARATLDHGGRVFTLDASDMPSDAPLAGVLRY